MRMRCKVRLRQIGAGYNGARQVTFYPVQDGSEENKQFFNATPSGKFELEIRAEAAAKLGLERVGLDEEFYVDFIPAGDVDAATAPAS